MRRAECWSRSVGRWVREVSATGVELAGAVFLIMAGWDLNRAVGLTVAGLACLVWANWGIGNGGDRDGQ